MEIHSLFISLSLMNKLKEANEGRQAGKHAWRVLVFSNIDNAIWHKYFKIEPSCTSDPKLLHVPPFTSSLLIGILHLNPYQNKPSQTPALFFVQRNLHTLFFMYDSSLLLLNPKMDQFQFSNPFQIYCCIHAPL